MFDDIKEAVDNYINLKRQTTQVESFLRTSLKAKLKNAKQEDVIETIIQLLNNQKSQECLKVQEAVIKSDNKFLTGENI